MNSTAKKNARLRYEQKNDIVTVQLRVPRSERDLWRGVAEIRGLTFTAYVRSLIQKDIASST